MQDNGTFYDSRTLDAVLAKVFDHIKNGRAADGDALLDEMGLREFVCGAD